MLLIKWSYAAWLSKANIGYQSLQEIINCGFHFLKPELIHALCNSSVCQLCGFTNLDFLVNWIVVQTVGKITENQVYIMANCYSCFDYNCSHD